MNRRPLRSAGSAVLLLIVTCAIGLSVDLFTKWLAFGNESTKLLDAVVRNEMDGRWDVYGSDARSVKVIPGLLQFHATVNEGAVFGLGQGKQTMFVAVSVGAIGFLLFLVSKTRSRFEAILLGSLLAGVLGNMYDRIRYGYVRDMLLGFPDVHWFGTWTIPGLNYPGGDRLVFPYIFNIADCLLVCGVGVLLIRSFFVTDKAAETTDDVAVART